MCKNIILVLFLSFALLGCSKEINLFFTSTEDIAKEIKPMIQEEFDHNKGFKEYTLKVLDLTVIKVQGNSYKGLAKVEHDGDIHNLTVNITYDGSNYMWEIPANEFLPITIESARQELDNIKTQSNNFSETYHENDNANTAAEEAYQATLAAASTEYTEYDVIENRKPSFNCAKASNYAERTVCSDLRLAKLDRLLTQNYKGMYYHSSSDDYSRNYWAKEQKAWLRERNKCTTVDCLTTYYETRINAICEQGVPTGLHPCVYTMDNFDDFDE